MNIPKKSGFTIIEVMLFLAITGLLIAGILGGTTQSLNNQRYRSGVEELRNTIRSQYATALSLQNLTADASGNTGDTSVNSIDPCSTIDSTAPVGPVQHVSRGASDCLYVGRLILIRAAAPENISHITVYPVIAKVVATGVSGIFTDASGGPLPSPTGVPTDQTTLKVAAFTQNTNIVSDQTASWGLVAVSPKPAQSLINAGILVFRSPMTGSLTTYLLSSAEVNAPTGLTDLQNYLDPAHKKDLKLCMADFNGSLDQAHRMAIMVHAGATNPGDIETLGEAGGC